MTHAEFTHIQDQILRLSGRDLAAQLGVPSSSVSNWRKSPEEGGRAVPDYIAILLGHLQAIHFAQVEVPLTVSEIMSLSALATRRGVSFGELLLTLVRDELHRSSPPSGETREALEHMQSMLHTAHDALINSAGQIPASGQTIPFPEMAAEEPTPYRTAPAPAPVPVPQPKQKP